MLLENTDIIVVLDTTLVKKELTPATPTEKTTFCAGFSRENSRTRDITPAKKTLVREGVDGSYLHFNYLNYLEEAWANHYGVILSPDIFWHLILSEIGSHVKEYNQIYRNLFTTSDEKVNISVPTADPQLIDLVLILEKLRVLVPTDVDLFVPKFSTSTPSSSLAFMAVFADAMTPYYSYSMYCCGIPKIKITGDVEDWTKVINNLTKLKEVLTVTEMTLYLDGVINLTNQIIDNLETPNIEFFKDIFSLVRCGSGSQVEVEGWITKLFMKVPSVRYVGNYPTCVSKVPYLFEDTNQNFELCYGLFSSNEEDGFLVPEFGFVINEINK